MTVFKNSNGKDYNIIYQSVDYALLQNINNCKDVVVAWALGDYSWGQGYYFDDVKRAIKFFNQKVGFKAV